MDWLELLEECIEKEILDKYNRIFYLNSIVFMEETKIDHAVSNKKLVQLLSQEEPELTSDILDFFLLENENQRDLVIILNPLELWEDESVFKTYSSIEEDFGNLPSMEQLKP